MKRRVKKGFVSKHRQTLYAQQTQHASVQQQPQSSYEGNVVAVQDQVQVTDKANEDDRSREETNNSKARQEYDLDNFKHQDPNALGQTEPKTIESNSQGADQSQEDSFQDQQPDQKRAAGDEQLNSDIILTPENNPKKVRRVRSTPRSERSQRSRNRKERVRAKGENSDSDVQISGSKPSE